MSSGRKSSVFCLVGILSFVVVFFVDMADLRLSVIGV